MPVLCNNQINLKARFFKSEFGKIDIAWVILNQ